MTDTETHTVSHGYRADAQLGSVRRSRVACHHRSSHLGIGLEPHASPPPDVRAISLWVYADDCDAAIDRLRQAGVPIVEEPADQPWGERVARVGIQTATK